MRAYITLKSYGIPDQVLENWDMFVVNEALSVIKQIEAERTFYQFTVADYSRLINAQPTKKDGSTDKSKYEELADKALQIKKDHINYQEPKPSLVSYILNNVQVSITEYKQIKQYLTNYKKQLYTAILCLTLDQ